MIHTESLATVTGRLYKRRHQMNSSITTPVMALFFDVGAVAAAFHVQLARSCSCAFSSLDVYRSWLSTGFDIPATPFSAPKRKIRWRGWHGNTLGFFPRYLAAPTYFFFVCRWLEATETRSLRRNLDWGCSTRTTL